MHITEFQTKKAFIAAVESHGFVYLTDPTCVDPASGYLEHVLDIKNSITVTNHPKRSWYAAVSRNLKTGAIIIK